MAIKSLNVGGAFHSPFMEPAVQQFSKYVLKKKYIFFGVSFVFVVCPNTQFRKTKKKQTSY